MLQPTEFYLIMNLLMLESDTLVEVGEKRYFQLLGPGVVTMLKPVGEAFMSVLQQINNRADATANMTTIGKLEVHTEQMKLLMTNVLFKGTKA
jgi:hypothetical protein